jgi:hypothetical protein
MYVGNGEILTIMTKKIDLNKQVMLYGRSYNVRSENQFGGRYPYIFTCLSKIYITDPEIFASEKNFKIFLADLIEQHGLLDGTYALNGSGAIKKIKGKAPNGAKTKRDLTNLCSFEKTGNIIKLRQTTNKKQHEKGNFTPVWKILIHEYKISHGEKDNETGLGKYEERY